MIPEKLWQFSQKFLMPLEAGQGTQATAALILKLFWQKMRAGFLFFVGYVIRLFWNYGVNYTGNYAPQTRLPGLENPDLPVENPHFSTVSTDFSTALFHRLHAAVYAETVDIMQKM